MSALDTWADSVADITVAVAGGTMTAAAGKAAIKALAPPWSDLGDSNPALRDRMIALLNQWTAIVDGVIDATVTGPVETTPGKVPVWGAGARQQVDGRGIGAATAGDLLDRAAGDGRYLFRTSGRLLGGYNMVINSSAALGLLGWQGSGGSVPEAAPETTLFQKFFPSPAAAVTGAINSGGAIYGSGTGRITVFAGQIYSFQVEMVATNLTAGSVSAVLYWFDAGGALIGNVTLTAVPGTDWASYQSVGVPAPAGAVTASVNLQINAATFAANGYAGWRKIKMELGAVATSWSDDATAFGLNNKKLDLAGGAMTGPLQKASYTVGTVPSAAAFPRGEIYVSNEAGGAIPAFSDGVNWRRVTDRAVIS